MGNSVHRNLLLLFRSVLTKKVVSTLFIARGSQAYRT